MIIPCIDLMGGKVVQLVRGQKKALEVDSVDEMIERFHGFPELQVIDLDAAIGTGANDDLVTHVASRVPARIGGGVRTLDRFQKLVAQGASRVIVGTAAFTGDGINRQFLEQLDPARTLIALDTLEGRITVKGWRESLNLTAEQVVRELEPFAHGFLCTYVDKEGMLQGTDLAWYRRLRDATTREITAAGGISSYEEIATLTGWGIHCALGMSIYTGHLSLDELRRMQAGYAVLHDEVALPRLPDPA
ncbi:MAG: 1-(5-phosphoribosyl)-5-[(5-phosphoribosylamino)methylideneamino] imidazole-4-carboxamide isomerase [Bryobacteraceae bacterium]|nr:1-(5-phosphoribosyl)-5-[(5-phosphoribosylamino)methylideneamino] imidazole-4-carboxamide isomerase [Bryobacteraceae bacterium]